MTQVSHCPRRCRQALARAAGPVVLDLETTGLRRDHRIVSAGLFVDGVAHILFARSAHVSVCNLPLEEFREALRPLGRPDLVLVAHNARFDLSFLRREGITVRGEVRDTLKLLRLLDQDRGGDREATGRGEPRTDLRAPQGAPPRLDYKLKHVCAQLLGLRMPHFPGAIALAPYRVHAAYLACDLIGTRALYDFLWPQLTDGLRRYHRELIAPLLPVLLDMAGQGVCADPAFIEAECGKLGELLERISAEHRGRHGVALGMDERGMCDWLFRRLRLPVAQAEPQGSGLGPVARQGGDPAPAAVRGGPEGRRLPPPHRGLPAGGQPAGPSALPGPLHRPGDRTHSLHVRRQAGQRSDLLGASEPAAAGQGKGSRRGPGQLPQRPEGRRRLRVDRLRCRPGRHPRAGRCGRELPPDRRGAPDGPAPGAAGSARGPTGPLPRAPQAVPQPRFRRRRRPAPGLPPGRPLPAGPGVPLARRLLHQRRGDDDRSAPGRQGGAEPLQADHPGHRQRQGATLPGPRPELHRGGGATLPAGVRAGLPQGHGLQGDHVLADRPDRPDGDLRRPDPHGDRPPPAGDRTPGRDPGLVPPRGGLLGRGRAPGAVAAGADHLRAPGLERPQRAADLRLPARTAEPPGLRPVRRRIPAVPAAYPQLGLAQHPEGPGPGGRRPSTRGSTPRPARPSTSSVRGAPPTSPRG